MARITGIVLDEQENPIKNAVVTFTRIDNEAEGYGKSKEDGVFRITKVLPAGVYNWTVKLDGYVSVDGQMDVPEDDEPFDIGKIVLISEGGQPMPGTISGQVVDTQLPPGKIQNARVTATDAAGNVSPFVETQLDGTYQIPNLAAGVYTVDVLAIGFQNGQVANVNVVDGQDTPNVDFQLAAVAQPVALGSISGTVTDVQGHAVQGAQVTATDAAGNVSPFVQTQRDGTYQILNLAAGAYTVDIQIAGFQNARLPNIAVQAAQDTPNTDFQLVAALPQQVTSISGIVTNANGAAIDNLQVDAIEDRGVALPQQITQNGGKYTFANVPPGVYEITVSDPNNALHFLSARNVAVYAGQQITGIDFSVDVIDDFMGRLDDNRFSIEAPISMLEASEAVTLFSVVNLWLAGMERVATNGTPQDALGIIKLYNGLQNGALTDRRGSNGSNGSNGKFQFRDDKLLLDRIEGDVNTLRNTLISDLLPDMTGIAQNAKAFFNLGADNTVYANSQFPAFFNRYVDIGNDPLLAIDIRKEEVNNFFDKSKLEETYSLLRELKGLLLQLVRSLSRSGTAGTRVRNRKWASFEVRAMEVFATLAQERNDQDEDARTPWAVLADLTNKDSVTEVAPYVVLARHGGKLLDYALSIYTQTQNELEAFDNDHLRDLFQPQGNANEYWTTKIRREANVIKRYRLPRWG